MECNFNVSKNQIAFIPTFGIVNRKPYYGYPVFSLAFLWLNFQFCIVFGVKKYRPPTEQ